MKLQMVDLQSQYHARKNEFDAAIASVIESSAFIKGAEVQSLEKELQDYLGVKHAITCGNGTDALTIALWALDLQEGDEVITADFSFIAAAEATARVGLKPVLVDVNPDTFCIDVDKIQEAITPKTKAIIPVNLFGQAAELDKIMQIAEEHNLYVIEDCAQCFGAEYTIKGKTKKLGTIGHISITSFFPSKNLACFGDGGAMFTNNDSLAERMRMIANHGAQKKYYHLMVGVNSRLDGIQAAILRVKLRYINEYNQARFDAAMLYNQKLADVRWIKTPAIDVNSSHVFHQYTLVLDGVLNSDLQQYLSEKGIPTMIYFPVPISLQQAMEEFNSTPNPVAKELSTSVISLPMHTELSETQIEYICEAIKNYKND